VEPFVFFIAIPSAVRSY